jgi:D-cysteine desulfhydrase
MVRVATKTVIIDAIMDTPAAVGSADAALDRLPRLALVLAPTPLHALERLRAALGGPDRVPRLLIKRDDLNGVALGGNKLRKLEFLLADAQNQGCDVLLTAGAAQSNHCRQTAAVGAMLGMETHLCLRGPEPAMHTGNLILDDWLGAHLHFADPGESVTVRMEALAADLRREGRRPYVIPIGGSNAVGAVGYVAAAHELAYQCRDADYIVVATGSGGTQAGLEVGVRRAGLSMRVLGVGVAEPDTVSWPVDVANLANAIRARLGDVDESRVLKAADISCPMDWMGPFYAAPTPGCESAIRLLARTEGIFVDPVYSGKALHAMIDWVGSGRFAPTDTVVFWHTGGAPALFAHGHTSP